VYIYLNYISEYNPVKLNLLFKGSGYSHPELPLVSVYECWRYGFAHYSQKNTYLALTQKD
jgi:hypothetical protein